MPIPNADHVTPPRAAAGIVLATTALTLTAEISLAAFKGRFITVACDDGAGNESAFYIQFAQVGATDAAAARAEVGTDGTNLKIVQFCPGTRDWEIDSGTLACRIIPTAAGYARIFASGPQ